MPISPQHPAWDVLQDWAWAFEQREQGHFQAFAGSYVVILGAKLQGTGQDPTALRVEYALKLEVDPERLVIAYIDRVEDLLCPEFA